MKPYAYEVTTKRGVTYLVRAGSVAHENAVMFRYQLKPLYEDKKMRKFKFVGFPENKPTYYGEASLTIGKTYDVSYVDNDDSVVQPLALLLVSDDCGDEDLYEELRGFEEVIG